MYQVFTKLFQGHISKRHLAKVRHEILKAAMAKLDTPERHLAYVRARLGTGQGRRNFDPT